jgi:ribosomal protein S19E (S16A)
MPALRNPRQERFCQLLKQNIPPYRAYPLAGYKPHNGEPYRLRDNPRIKARLAELTRHIAMKTRVTVESLTQELDEISAGAKRSEQWAAAKGAVETKAKLHGLLVDRKETGAPGDFAQLESIDAIVAKVRSELGDSAADVLAKALAQSDQAVEADAGAGLGALERGDDALN